MRIKGGFGWDHREVIHGAHGGHGIFGGSLRLEILEEIFFKMLLRKK